MGQAEEAGRPPRSASAPARGRSRPPGSDEQDAAAPLKADGVRLGDGEVEEIEAELIDADLHRPADPAERARVENAKRRLADRALIEELAEAGFAGMVFDVAITEFAAYGIAVMMAWSRTGMIVAKCKQIGRPLSQAAPQWDREDRLEICIETAARALNYFVEQVLKPGKWDLDRGATLKTYFVGTCVLQFPNVFESWVTEQQRWTRVHDADQDLDDVVGRGDPQWADPTASAALRACTAHEVLASIPDPKTRQAAWMVLGHGASHAEAGAAVGLSAAGVEGRLHRLRKGRPQ